MYSQLIDVAADNEIWSNLPESLDAKLCMQLIDTYETFQPSITLTFSAGRAGIGRDYLPVQRVSGGWLCSQRFLDVLTKASVPFTAYPAQLLEQDTEQPIEANYSFWMPYRIKNAIDVQRSQIRTDPETGRRSFLEIVLTEECEKTAPLLFHARGSGRYFVHDSLRIQLVEAGITGIDFAPLDAASAPKVGIKKQTLERALQEHPDDWEKWVSLSDALVQLNYYQEALVPLKKALALKPNWEKAWYKYGRLLYRLKRFQEALEALQQAVERQPESAAWGEYCATLRELGKNEEALKHAQHWAKIWSHSPLPWYELGATYAALGRYSDALPALDKSLELGGGARVEDVFRLLGSVLSTLGRYDEALEVYEEVLKTYPQKKIFWVGKATALKYLGLSEEAEKAEQHIRQLEILREENLKRRPL